MRYDPEQQLHTNMEPPPCCEDQEEPFQMTGWAVVYDGLLVSAPPSPSRSEVHAHAELVALLSTDASHKTSAGYY